MKAEATGAAGPFLISHPDGWAEVIFDDPTRPVNVLTVAVMERLEALVASFHSQARDPAGSLAGVLFRSGKAASFLAGADVDAMESISSAEAAEGVARRGQVLFQSIADLPVPTVAAIHGPCVGGGTELALACDFRLLADDPRTTLSLPEVRLGILPAWGGTTRLPLLIGLLPALPLLLTGRPVRPKEALDLGLVDAVYPAQLMVEDSLTLARALLLPGGTHPGRTSRGGVRRWIHRLPGGRALILRQARRTVLRETDGEAPAPLAILDLLGATGGRGNAAAIAQGLTLEARALGELLPSPTSRNLRHLFRLQQDARRPVDGGDPIPREALPGLFLEAHPGGMGHDDLLHRARTRGLRVETGPLHTLATLQGGPEGWVVATPPHKVRDTIGLLPDAWKLRVVGLGRPQGVQRGPLLEVVSPEATALTPDGSNGSSTIEPLLRLLREAHALGLALGGIPILVKGPEDVIGTMVRSLALRTAAVTGHPEALAYHRLILALEALGSGHFRSAGMVDLAMVLAEIAPPWRGGPLHEADEAGLASTRARLERGITQWGQSLCIPALLEAPIVKDTLLRDLDPWGTWHPYGSGPFS